ncbi:MAG TPA: RluA family pseudouridine synthase [Desulfobacterales bacterium]|nr:RluA family pseudouridine synthase [Desulfobacterales bacterium]
MSDTNAFRLFADESNSGQRLDTFIASHIVNCSRSRAASLIRNGIIDVDGGKKKPGYRIKTGDKISGYIPAPESIQYEPEAIPIDLLYVDNDLIVINKQPGLVVHPAAGHYNGTLVNALLYHFPELQGIGGKVRPGIVHRLDKDTSGTMVVAKNDLSHNFLSLQFKSRKVKKEYLALVHGEISDDSGEISLPIGRHPMDRKKMSTISRRSRQAFTFWQVQERFFYITLLKLNLMTGRTHQIRVHCSAINHPILGDPVYSSRKKERDIVLKLGCSESASSISRQMLHAWRISFTHPVTGKIMSFESPIPPDMQGLINELRRKASIN